MRKIFWVAILIGSVLLMGAMVAAEDKTAQSTFPQMPGMGSMVGGGMMGKGEQMSPMGQMDSMMQMMQRMSQMMEACAQMMGNPPPASQEGNK